MLDGIYDAKKVIVLISGGRKQITSDLLNQCKSLSTESDIIIDTISLGRDSDELKQIAEATNGQYFAIKDATTISQDQLDEIYAEIISGLKESGLRKNPSENFNPYIPDDGLFEESDFDLNPEVQQMISYYDDLYLYNQVALDQGIIDQYEFNALKQKCEDEVAKYRNDNAVDSINTDDITQFVFFDILVASIPYIGLSFSDATVVNAATLDQSATKKISDNSAAIAAVIATSAKFKTNNTIYELYDTVTDENGIEKQIVRYVGRTRQNILKRKMQHWYTDKNKKGLDIRVAEYEGKPLENLSYSEARGLEQIVFDADVKLAKINGEKELLNKIDPIKNGTEITEKILQGEEVSGKGANYIKIALKFLGKIE